ncbi:helix-turn-helix transcriptional regulator [Saccharopolyspora sp. K220]|uniref:helix-turn-helix transcriptional regulator n=1 Tax=Saccharopolyspora soli TaxID=2926618 RepID=UPI001F584ADC|nr:helix-turn-helix transcriptional regulator [Saccharopolyspora soli]MCI2423755.1 helix-turn-helix transcriptional regulator [Saccharopolyspora soli]
MTGDNALRDFLTSRRAAIEPWQVGLPQSKTVRRVPGLRRGEVAILAGVSVDYYTKLEQGRVGKVSDEVLSAIGNALQLNDLEHQHFRTLVNNGNRRTGELRAATIKARPGLVAMIHALNPVPALIHGPRYEVLAANHTAKLLIDDFDAMPATERNLVRWTFLSPRARVVYPEWQVIAPQVAAALRHLAVDRAADPLLEQLVGELAIASPEFARYWADYQLYEHSYGAKRFFNETVGELTLHYETLALPSDHGQHVITYTADRGSPSEEKLQLLASWNAPAREPADQPDAEQRPS